MNDFSLDRGGNIAGIVLAGGRSSRMRENKAFLDFYGRPLVDHMIGLLQEAGAADVSVSGDLEGYPCIPDEDIYPGPAAAIRTVMAALKDKNYDGVLFVPVDMPFLNPALLKALITDRRSAHYEGWPLPLYLCGDQIPAEGQAVKEMLLQMNRKIWAVPIGAEKFFMNLNTPEDWQEAVQR